MDILKPFVKSAGKVIRDANARKFIVKEIAKSPENYATLSKGLGSLSRSERKLLIDEIHRLKSVVDPIEGFVPVSTPSAKTSVPPIQATAQSTIKPPIKPPVPIGRKLPDFPESVVEIPDKPSPLDLLPVKEKPGKITEIDTRLIRNVTKGRGFIGVQKKKVKQIQDLKQRKEFVSKAEAHNSERALDVREKWNDPFLGMSSVERFANYLIESGAMPAKRAVQDFPIRVKSGIKTRMKVVPTTIEEIFGSTHGVVGKLKDVGEFALRWGSPHYLGQRIFGTIDNPVSDATMCFVGQIRNTANAKLWSGKLFGTQRLGTDKLKDSSKDISREASAVLERVNKPYRATIRLAGVYQSLLAKAGKKPTKKQIHVLTTLAKKINEQQAKWLPEWEQLMNDLTTKYTDARVYFGAMYESALAKPHTGTGRDRLWFMRNKLSDEEREMARGMRKYFDERGSTAERIGLDVLGSGDLGEQYAPYLWKSLLEPKLKSATRVKFERGFPHMREYLNFMERAEQTKTWVPSARAAMDYYVPTIERKLAMQPFHTKWHPFIDKLEKKVKSHTATPGETKFLNWWHSWYTDTLNRDSYNWASKAIDTFTTFEYMRLVGFNPGVAFKHLLKMTGTPIEMGFASWAQSVPSVGRMVAQYAKQRAGKRLGIKSWEDGFYAHLLIGEHFLQNRAIFQSMLEMPGMPGLIYNAKALFSFPTSPVELLDRGITIMSALHTGARRGASMYATEKQIISSILDINFLGGFDQPRFMRHPVGRFLSMFQFTPTKIMERHVKSVTGAIGDVKHVLVDQALDGINAGKIRTDMFGTHEGTKVLRGLMLIGGMSLVADKVFDTNIEQYMVHMPFFQRTPTGVYAPTRPPLLQGILDTATKGTPWLDSLYDHMTYMGIADKFRNIWGEGAIPPVYQDNPWRYILALPPESVRVSNEERRLIQYQMKRWRRKAMSNETLIQSWASDLFGDEYKPPQARRDPLEGKKYLWGE